MAPVLCAGWRFLEAIFVIHEHITHLCDEAQHRPPRISESLGPHDSHNIRREKQSRQAACSAGLKAIHLSTRAKHRPGPSYKSGLVPRGITFSKSAISSIYIPFCNEKWPYELVSTICWQRPPRAQQFSQCDCTGEGTVFLAPRMGGPRRAAWCIHIVYRPTP